ncbi:unnamed protein product, partial [Adineta steineri]
MVRSCIACSNKEGSSQNVSFHRLPKNTNLRETWLKRLNRHDLKKYSNIVVCSSHFLPSSFIMKSKKKINDTGRTRLKSSAVPVEVLSLTINDTRTMQSSSTSTQTDLDMITLTAMFTKLSLLEQKVFNTVLCIERFENDDYYVNYYTGFKSYRIFEMVFELLDSYFDEHFTMYSTRVECGLQYNKLTDTYKLSKMNQFFLFMVRLRRGTDIQELAFYLLGLIGISPNGVISYVSSLYGGATTDRALLNMEGPGSLIELLENGDQIMSDRGFSLE